MATHRSVASVACMGEFVTEDAGVAGGSVKDDESRKETTRVQHARFAGKRGRFEDVSDMRAKTICQIPRSLDPEVEARETQQIRQLQLSNASVCDGATEKAMEDEERTGKLRSLPPSTDSCESKEPQGTDSLARREGSTGSYGEWGCDWSDETEESDTDATSSVSGSLSDLSLCAACEGEGEGTDLGFLAEDCPI